MSMLPHSHSSLQICSLSYLLNVFQYSKDIIGYCGCNVSRLATNFGKKKKFLYHETICLETLLRVPLYHLLSICISIKSVHVYLFWCIFLYVVFRAPLKIGIS